MGNRLIYEDTFAQALDRLSGGQFLAGLASTVSDTGEPEGDVGTAAVATTDSGAGRRLRALAQRLRQLRAQAQQLVDQLGIVERDLER